MLHGLAPVLLFHSIFGGKKVTPAEDELTEANCQ